MANEIDFSNLTTEDYQDYWNQFLRFYADETGKNFSKKIPITILLFVEYKNLAYRNLSKIHIDLIL